MAPPRGCEGVAYGNMMEEGGTSVTLILTIWAKGPKDRLE